MNIRLLCPQNNSRQEYWSGLPSPPPGNLPYPGTETSSLAAGFFFFFPTTSATWEAHPKEGTNYYFIISIIALDTAGIREKWLAKSHRPSCLEGACVGLMLCCCCFKFLKFFFNKGVPQFCTLHWPWPKIIQLLKAEWIITPLKKEEEHTWSKEACWCGAGLGPLPREVPSLVHSITGRTLALPLLEEVG